MDPGAKNEEFQVIFTGNPIDGEMIDQLLNENGIETMVNNQLMGSIAPWQVTAGGFNPVEIVINKNERDKAHQLIEEFKGSK